MVFVKHTVICGLRHVCLSRGPISLSAHRHWPFTTPSPQRAPQEEETLQCRNVSTSGVGVWNMKLIKPCIKALRSDIYRQSNLVTFGFLETLKSVAFDQNKVLCLQITFHMWRALGLGFKPASPANSQQAAFLRLLCLNAWSQTISQRRFNVRHSFFRIDEDQRNFTSTSSKLKAFIYVRNCFSHYWHQACNSLQTCENLD